MEIDLTDEQLMERYRDGDLPAFRELYRRHSRGLYQFIHWRSPRRDWVDEIAQDTWTALHGSRQRYQASAAFKTYLFQIARNRLLDLLRQHQHVLASDLTEGRYDEMADGDGDEPGPDLRIGQAREAARVHAALTRLPAEQREAVVLQQFNDMSLEQIAALTGVSSETVKSRLRYAMRKLREQFAMTTTQENAT